MSIKQIFTVGDSEQPSASQIWFHVINILVAGVYLFIGIRVGLLIKEGVINAPQLIDSLVFFTLVISGLITGNKFANMLVNLKYGKKEDEKLTKEK